MKTHSFFDKNIYTYTASSFLEYIEFIDFILDDSNKPRWLKFILQDREQWYFAKKHNLSIGLYYPFSEDNGLKDSLIVVRNNSSYLVEGMSSCCPNCNQPYEALTIRHYSIYFGFSKEIYNWAMNDVPYLTQCLNCGYDWNEEGLRYFAIFQNGKKKYAV